jgi:hypothetical protein
MLNAAQSDITGHSIPSCFLAMRLNLNVLALSKNLKKIIKKSTEFMK